MEKNTPTSAREYWVHEDRLIDHRLSWLGVTQTLLFGALGFLLLHQSGKTVQNEQLEFLVKSLPYLGLATSFFVLVGVLGAVISMCHIRRRNCEELLVQTPRS